jgi:heptosyltransferase-2
MKLLLIRFSSIGDIILTTPVIRCLKKQLPGVEIHFLTKESFRGILESNPYVDKIHVLAHSWEQMIHELKLEEYDHVIDLHHNLRTMRVKKALDRPAHSFNKLNLQKLVFVNLKLNVMPREHIVDRYLDTVKFLGVKNDGTGLDYFIPEKDETKRPDIPASHHAGFIAIVIGAAHFTKRYPTHKLEAFCKQFDHPVILLGGKEDRAEGDKISAVDPVKIYNACGKFNLNESADLVRKSKLVITNDTGLMHIAAALKKPIISLWGNTVPSFGMYPYYGENYLAHHPRPYDLLQTRHLWCRPCSKIGYSKCPLGHFKCMEKIDIDLLEERVKARM